MYDIAIIGAGPAGGSAAIFAAKGDKKTIVFDDGKSITAKAWVENHYGVSEIPGPDMIRKGRQQAEKFGAEIKEEEVTAIHKKDSGFQLVTANGDFEAEHILFASGLSVDLAETSGLNIVEGKEPRIKKIIDIDSDGRTNKENIWAAGTVAGESVHTIVTAGHGAKVSINIISELNGKRYVDHDVLKG